VPPVRLHHLALTVNDVDASVRVDTANRPLTQSPIADEPYGCVLVFRDPDNIQLELFSPAGI
jgi:hypothetical protein